jgi:arylsulfatase A-like enzyme
MKRMISSLEVLLRGIRVVVALFGVWNLGHTESRGEGGAQRPNIVVILGDDVGYGDLSCYGAEAVRTPHIDRLAREGLRFAQGYCTASTCTPSRYSLMTGEYAFRKKGTGILPGDAALIIEPGRLTLPSMLQKGGYRTAVVGKWHLGLGDARGVDWNGEIRPSPLEVGFDYSFIMAATGDRTPCVYVENRGVVGRVPGDRIEVNYKEAFPGEPDGVKDRATLRMDWSHGHNQAVLNGIGRIGYMKGGKSAVWKDEDMADVFTQRALDFMEREKGRPFFLYFATHDIHVPRVPHARHVGKTSMGPRGDALVEFDDSVGRILSKLDELGLSENTLVILSSDNGPVLDDGYQDEANEKLGGHRPAGGLRAGKNSLFEGGTRVPFLVRWPKRVRVGVSEALVSQVDLCASLAALTGQKTDPVAMLDSENVLPALLGESKAGRESLVEHSGRVAFREGAWKFIPPGAVTDLLGPRVQLQVPEPGWLFDLSKDPGEREDVAAQFPEIRQRLSEHLAATVARGPSVLDGRGGSKKRAQ